MPEHLPPTGHHGDRAERLLRRALDAQAAAVDPGDVPRVGELVDRRRPRRWPAALGAAAAVAALAVTSAVALGTDLAPAPVAAPTASASASAAPSAPTAPTAPTGPASSEPSPDGTDTATPSAGPSTTDVPVVTPSPDPSTEVPTCPAAETSVLLWSVVEQHTGDGTALRLVPDRARVPVPAADDGCAGDPSDPEVRVGAAVLGLLGAPAPDAAHTNLWFDGTGRRQPVPVSTGPDGTTVDLPSSAFGAQLGSEAAASAVAAMVRTVVSNGGPAPVTLLVDGEAGAEAWGVLVLGEPMSPSGDDLAGGWILDPYEGQRLAAGTVTLSGTATAFEATVSWLVRGPDGATVAEGVTEAGSNGTYGPWTVPVELGPGTWTAVLRAENMAGPDEGPGPWLWEDTTTFTVVP